MSRSTSLGQLALVIVMAAATACGGDAKAGDQRALSEAEAVQQKLSPYIECTNRHTNRAIDSGNMYFQSVDHDKGPKPGQGASLYEIYDPSGCATQIAAARTQEPRLPELEAAGDAYIAALTALYPLTKEANDYYDKKNYKDDRSAKGIAMHPKLAAAFEAFAAANEKLAAQVSALNEKARADDLAAREKQGRTPDVIIDQMMNAAKDVMRTEAVAWQEMSKLDVPTLTDKIAKLEGLVAEAAPLPQKTGFASMFPDKAKKFLMTSKDLMRRARDKVAWSSGDKINLGTDGEWMVEGSPGRALRDYNELVDAYNRL